MNEDITKQVNKLLLKHVPSVTTGIQEVIQKTPMADDVLMKLKHKITGSLYYELSDNEVEKSVVIYLIISKPLQKLIGNDTVFVENNVGNWLYQSAMYFDCSAEIEPLNDFYEYVNNIYKSGTDKDRKYLIMSMVSGLMCTYDSKEADKFGVVYTPQEVTDFIVNSVNQALITEFGEEDGIASNGVDITDPCTGTGNFITAVMDKIHEMNENSLEQKFNKEINSNEISLIPYYVSTLNLENNYHKLTGKYRQVDPLLIRLCDTLDYTEDLDDKQKYLF